MHPIDWIIVVGYIAWLVWDGVKRTRLERTTESYFLASRSLPWWAVGLSVMATQLSAITLVGTTGQGFSDGLRFIQFYIGLPIAMLVLSVTLVPFFYKARVYTAYEYLEQRFDLKTRTLTSLLFLLSRGMSCGAVVAAPAVVLSVILGWDVTLTALAICVPAVIYTILGGVQAVTWTDVKVMGLTVFVLVAAVVVLIVELPAGHDDRRCAAARGRGGTPRCVRLPVQPHGDLHDLVRPDRRAVPDAVVFRLRPEPGAAVSDRALARPGALVALHDRLLEDPAAGPGPDRRRPHLFLLCLPSAADALQSRARADGEAERTGAAVRGAREGLPARLRRRVDGGGSGGRCGTIGGSGALARGRQHVPRARERGARDHEPRART